jgi:hypothetical protein
MRLIRSGMCSVLREESSVSKLLNKNFDPPTSPEIEPFQILEQRLETIETTESRVKRRHWQEEDIQFSDLHSSYYYACHPSFIISIPFNSQCSFHAVR